MAILTNGLITFALLLTTIILETGNFSGHVLPVHKEEHFVFREKRNAPADLVEYEVEVELNVTGSETVRYLRSLLDSGNFTLALGPTVNVTHIDITTVCYPNGNNFQCRCEDQYAWPYEHCITYGACDSILGGTCRCINSIPTNGHYCQPQTVLPVLYEYQISIEVNTTDADTLINLLNNIPFPVQISNQFNISEVNITTVCNQVDAGIQCQCRDDYLWPCDKCATYGKCDGNTTGTCGCIKAFPNDGQYCQSVHHHNFTACPPSTAPPLLYEYVITIELNISDVTLIRSLLFILREIIYPFKINNEVQIYGVNISTVCSPSSGGYQCRCEDQYRWPCDQCVMYGTCDNITEDTCGCIKAVPPDGRYCRPADQHNFTACSTTTTTSPTSSTTITTTTVNTTTPTISTTPPVVYEYVISIELNTTDDTVKDLLSDISYPFSITEGIQVSDLNISTVCSPSSGSYQCRCEDQYRWPCDQCVMYGTCDNITEDTCGCIKAVPPDGRYCRPADQHNFTACSTTTTTSPTSSTTITTTTVNTTTPTISTTPPVVYEYVISIELNTTDDTVKDLLSDISYPFSITEGIQVSDLNISTVCSPSSGSYQCRCEDQYRWPCDQCVMYGTCDNITEDTCGCIKAVPPDGRYCRPADQHNFTACSTTTTTSPTSSTTITTTTVNTTTPTISTTDMNTTAVTTPPTTIVTNTTTAVTTTSIMMTTTSSVTDQNSSTSVSVTSPAPNTNSTTATTTTITIPTTTVSTEFNVIMSIELNKTFTEELNDASSAPYTELKSEIERVLVDKYRNITGFLSVSVIRFRNGSVITDFVVNTRQIIPDEVAIANKNLTEAIESIAPVIGSVTALYKSPDPISFPSVTYTGQTMKLMCQISDNLNVGEISGSVWKFKGRKIENTERTKVSSSGGTTNLTINNVILRDIGLYECDLTGGIITFSQNGNVTNIRPAPVIRLQSQVNVQCQGTGGQTQSLECCVQSNYNIKWFRGSDQLTSTVNSLNEETCIEHDYFLESCSESEPIDFICKVDNLPYEERTRMNIFSGAIACNDEDSFGAGQEGDISRIRCDEGQEGYKEARCVSANWLFVVDTCIVTEIKELLIGSKDLVPNEVPTFVDELRLAVENEQTEIVDSSATISAIVDIIGNVAGIIGDEVSESVIEDVLQTVDVIIGDDSRESWAFLNANETSNSSSSLLGALETLASGLNGEVVVETPRILLKRNTFNNNFTANLNSSVTIELPYTNQVNVFITTITFPTLNNVMPVRNSSFDTSLLNETVINGAVVLVQINDTARNVTLSYSKLNKSLSEVPQCVFWNFALFDNLGAWDKEGCTFFSDKNNMVTCNCSHLTSFSILMSTNIPPELSVALDVITYVGVAISLASLVICLIIEGYVWKAITKNSTAFMRHVCIINTALSLLIADICFIIGAFIAKNPLENPGEEHNVPVGPCSTATFFMHFFYLALFFWMLVSGLLLFYRTVMVFSHMSKSAMLGIGFLLGYGCPLIIAVITVAVTAPGNEYIRRDNACWLNWFESHALLALVIPALTIVSINLVIVVVVLFKMLRRGVGDAAQTDERHTLVVILRCVVILTPLFGLTWALGIGTMISSTNKGLHIAFAFFNSLQGFFILVFGTLFDSKIRSILSRKLPTSSTGSNNTTRSTSGGISSPSDSVLNWIHRLRGRRYIYHVSEMANSSSTSASESFINI